MGTIKHAFTSPVTDTGDPDLVGPDEWNDDHDVTLDATDVGADASGTAAAAVATHSADTTSVHGITDTSALATSTDLAGYIAKPVGPDDGDSLAFDGSAWVGRSTLGGIDVRDYGVSSAASSTDNATGMQAALDAAGNRSVYIPPNLGVVAFNTTIEINTQQIVICPQMGSAGGTTFSYVGADATPAFRFVSGGAAVSRVLVQGVRVDDDRVGATSGGGFVSDTVAIRNGSRIIDCNAFDFPDYGFYFDAATGSDGELVIENCWATAGLYGFHFGDLTAQTVIRGVFGDSITGSTPAMDALLHFDNTYATAAVSVTGAKLETDNGCHLILLGSTWRAPLVAEGLTMRGTVDTGGDVVQINHLEADVTVVAAASRPTSSAVAGRVARYLVNDVARGRTYGASGSRMLSFYTTNNYDTSGNPAYFANAGLVTERLNLPEGNPFDDGYLALGQTFYNEADQTVWSYNGAWSGVELT